MNRIPRRSREGLLAAACALAMLCGTSIHAQSTPAPARTPPEPLPEGYWPRGKRPEPGMAPGMRVTDMGAAGHSYRLNFVRGDEVMSGMVDFAQAHHIANAHFVGLGAIDRGTLGWTDTERSNGQKMIPIAEEAEVIAFSGSISTNAQGVATVHGHGAVSLQDGSVIGGHVFELHISIIGEVWVTEETPPAEPGR